jgi:hypothetical protein
MFRKKKHKQTVEDLLQAYHQSFPFLRGNVFEAFLAMNIYLREKRIPYIIVGSIALRALGIPLNREVHDIDIEVIANECQERIFKEFADASGNHLHEQKETALREFEHKPYMFICNGTQVNVWVSRERFSHPRTVQIAGIGFPTVDTLLQAKATYHRPKDLDDFLFITQELMGTICGRENLDRLMPRINIEGIKEVILKKDGREETR